MALPLDSTATVNELREYPEEGTKTLGNLLPLGDTAVRVVFVLGWLAFLTFLLVVLVL